MSCKLSLGDESHCPVALWLSYRFHFSPPVIKETKCSYLLCRWNNKLQLWIGLLYFLRTDYMIPKHLVCLFANLLQMFLDGRSILLLLMLMFIPGYPGTHCVALSWKKLKINKKNWGPGSPLLRRNANKSCA